MHKSHVTAGDVGLQLVHISHHLLGMKICAAAKTLEYLIHKWADLPVPLGAYFFADSNSRFTINQNSPRVPAVFKRQVRQFSNDARIACFRKTFNGYNTRVTPTEHR